MKAMVRREDTRTKAVRGLFESLILFSQTMRARGADWNHVVSDLTRGDVMMLGALDVRGTARPGQIAAALGVDPSVVSRQLVGLVRLGLVVRTPDPDDGRAELIALTDDGRARLAQARTAMCEVLAERLDQWPLEDLTRATAMVADLADRLQHPIRTPYPPTSHERTEDSASHD